MIGLSNVYEGKLQKAAEYLSTGQKKKARLLLRDVLAADENNLEAWELLFRASYTPREQIICLREILRIQPGHPWARQQLAFIRAVNFDKDGWEAPTHSTSISRISTSTIRRASREKRRQEPMLVWATIMLAFLGVICIATWALAALRLGILPGFAPSGTATAQAINQAACQTLIERAIQASGQSCNQIGSNHVCYGNNTLKVELASNSGQSFSRRGDIVNVAELQRLSASPLNTESNEWGVAIFQIQANLPRSLPGEMVKLIVFGNTNLRKNNGDLQSFYFSSELGQLICEKLPYDGLMITMPNGTGVRFSVNGAELILMGNASLKATKNGAMQVSMYSGSGRIRSGGRERYFGAGQKVLVPLGGVDGTEAIGDPSAPQPLSPAEYNVACSLTRGYCSPGEISPLSPQQITGRILNGLGATSTFIETPTGIFTMGPSASPFPSMTSIPSLTPISPFTLPPTRTLTPLPLPTRTRRPTSIPTDTIPPAISTDTVTSIPPMATNTQPFPTLTPLPTFTPIPSATLPPTDTPAAVDACGGIKTSGLSNSDASLRVNISNNHGSPVTLASVHVEWVKDTPSQKLDRLLLNDNLIWNTSDPEPPSDLPGESGWRSGAILTIPDTTSAPLVAQFQDLLEPGNYSVTVTLDTGCQLQEATTVP